MGQRKLFITLFRAELEDSLEGLEHLSYILEHRLNNGEITNYVFNENETLLSREISGIKRILSAFDAVDPDGYQSVEALAQGTVEVLKQKAAEQDESQAVQGIIERKTKKVLNYILNGRSE
ncbi:MAG: hypothetical protein LBN21_05840 [Treponema sp.]|jgi:alpha-amylase/alpha-mannosidase (GH57 family)|nr:hypothetical protein [Treponema sp.]